MKRNIIKIDEQKCNGCGLCVNACAEGALKLIDGKAKLVSESYCDGLGACLPECPMDAISLEERESAPFDEKAVEQHLKSKEQKPCFSCPSQKPKTISRNSTAPQNDTHFESESQLNQWPCQIKLVPSNAPYLRNANLLVAADCTAFAYADIHNKFMKNKITLIGCPKLDSGDYADKLGQILENNDIKSLTVLKMEVPCCSGLANAVKNALIKSKKMIPWQIITISIDGKIIED